MHRPKTEEELESLEQDREAILGWVRVTIHRLQELQKVMAPPADLEETANVVSTLYRNRTGMDSVLGLAEAEARRLS